MPTDYETLYRETKHALGSPTKEFKNFFDGYAKPHAYVLDIGCGQGRDALFIARLGHHVTGVDQSASGISDLLHDAIAEKLDIEGVVADVCAFRPRRRYDVIIIDRTLHMLRAEDRVSILQMLLPSIADNGFALIADERKNLPALQSVFDDSNRNWTPILKTRGFLFQRHR